MTNINQKNLIHILQKIASQTLAKKIIANIEREITMVNNNNKNNNNRTHLNYKKNSH